MSFKDLTPEQRAAMVAKSAATRRANAAAKTRAALEAVQTPSDKGISRQASAQVLAAFNEPAEPQTLADLGFVAPVEEAPGLDVLSVEEIEAARIAGRKKYADEQKRKARQAATDAAYDDARRDAGTMPADEEEARARKEIVSIRIQMPTLRKPTGGELPPEPIILDQRVFVSGRTYQVERHVANYLASLMDHVRRHVNQVDGRSKTYYAQDVGQMIYQGGTAAGGAGGPSFDAIHRRPAA